MLFKNKLLCLLLPVLALSAASAIAQTEHCVAVYQSATRNLNISEASYSSLNTIFDDYCSSSGEVKSSASSAGIEAVISKIPIKFSGNSGSTSERMSSFCRNYSSVRYDTAASSAFSDTVVVDALKAFNECVEISRSGVKVIHSAPTGLESTFSFQFGSNLKYELQGVQTGANISCSMKNPAGSGTIALDKSSNIVFEKNFSAFCNREPIINPSDGRKTYPRTSVTFASNHGSYSAIYPEEEVQSAQFASAIDARLKAAESRLTQVAKTIEANKAENRSYVDARADAVVAQINELKGKLGVKVLMVMRGEHANFAHPNWTTVGCGSVESYAQSQCPGAQIDYTQVYQRSGNRCGYTYFVIACTNK